MEDTDSPSPEELKLSPEGSPEFNLEASPEGDEYIPQTEKPKRKSAAGRELVRWDREYLPAISHFSTFANTEKPTRTSSSFCVLITFAVLRA